MKQLLILLTLLFSPVCFGFDSSNVGVYAIVHKTGEVTNFVFYVSEQSGKWDIEQRKISGEWESVACENDCILNISSTADIEKFIPQDVLAKQKFECIQNTAFAFCHYQLIENTQRAGYVMIALVTQRPTPIPLKKVGQIKPA
ncbi:MAG: hypothetical protein PHU06_04335 [Gallionella sp.]|nr:hypothetical protein [Gallionella sp.]MDD4957908.1 hypothetical protein [Gallionella sp.]